MNPFANHVVTTIEPFAPDMLTRAQSAWTEEDQQRWGNWSALLPSSFSRSLSGAWVSPESALSLIAYYGAINCISTDIASLPLEIFQRKPGNGGRVLLREDPRTELLSTSPDEERPAMRWRQTMIAYMLGYGNGCSEIEFANSGYPFALHLLDPGTRAGRDPHKKLVYPLTNGKTLRPTRVIHWAGLSRDGINGYSVARLASESIGLSLAAERFGGSFFGNAARPSGSIEVPDILTDVARKNMREGVERLHSGYHNTGRILLLEQGAKWNPMSIPPEDAQFLQTRQFQVIEIARLFRLPPHKLGDYSQAHLTNIEASNIDYLATVIMPWCRVIEQELNRKLFTREERAAGYYVEHDLRAFLRGDAKARSEYYRILRDLGALSPNEIRQLENMDPIEGGDVYLVPLNMTTLQNAGDPELQKTVTRMRLNQLLQRLGDLNSLLEPSENGHATAA